MPDIFEEIKAAKQHGENIGNGHSSARWMGCTGSENEFRELCEPKWLSRVALHHASKEASCNLRTRRTGVAAITEGRIARHDDRVDPAASLGRLKP